MKSYDQHYYDGAWQPSTVTDTIDVISSATEAVVGRVPRGSAEDVDRAV
jgi:aldehyde dehydrogenase (NAD+)